MKNIVFIFSVLFCLQSTFADETPTIQSSTYGSAGGGFPNTITGTLGKRIQSHHHGVDFGIGASTFIIFPSEIYGYCNYLYYPKPDLTSQYYTGLGLKGSYGLLLSHWSGGVPLDGFRVEPHWIIGKEFLTRYQKRNFLQGNFGAFYYSDKGGKTCPIITVTYGFMF